MARNEWQLWSDFIGLFVATGYLRGEPAQSLLLVGDPGEGKSAILHRFFDVPTTIVAMDATAEGLKQQVFPRAIKERKRHLLMPEMYKLMQRRGPTAENTIGVLTLAMSGEMLDSYIGPSQLDQFPEGFQLGVIGAMPSKIFDEWRTTINNTGLLSRMMPVPFRLSDELRAQIKVAIAKRDKRMLAPVRFKWPTAPVDITYTHHLSVPVIRMVDDIIGKSHGQHNRFIDMLVCLVKSVALLEGDSVCKERHVDALREFIPILRGDAL